LFHKESRESRGGCDCLSRRAKRCRKAALQPRVLMTGVTPLTTYFFVGTPMVISPPSTL